MITREEFTPDKRRKFISNVKVVFGACWEWQGTKRTNGYGSFYAKNKQTQAHRVMYAWVVAPIPQDYVVHHICDNKGCVNPDHLAPMSHSIHTSIHHGPLHNANKTHCKKGHPFSDENTIITLWENGTFRGRKCRVCTNARQRKRRACTEEEPVPEFDTEGEDSRASLEALAISLEADGMTVLRDFKKPCPDCGGSGVRKKETMFSNVSRYEPCLTCKKDGTGREVER